MISLDGAWVDGYHALTLPCPRCGDDTLWHLDLDGDGAISPALAERPCGCRLTARQIEALWVLAETTVETMERTGRLRPVGGGAA